MKEVNGRMLPASCAGPSWCEGADVDRSGAVDLVDLGYVLENWLAN